MHKAPDPKSYEFFLATWQVYRKIVDGNYMYHQEIFGEALKILGEGAKGRLTILDLGCGDAGAIRPVLEQIPFSSYVGADASEPALELAKEELKIFGDRIELQCGDMVSFLKANTSRKFAVILASFSLHHLDTEQKREFLALCKQRLEPRGQLIIADVFRNAGQSREDYLDAYCEDMNRRWTMLSPEEGQIAIEHVRTHDFPESLEDFLHIAGETGLSVKGLPIRHGYHGLAAFGI
jgi:SAM-dependent methyltransferase